MCGVASKLQINPAPAVIRDVLADKGRRGIAVKIANAPVLIEHTVIIQRSGMYPGTREIILTPPRLQASPEHSFCLHRCCFILFLVSAFPNLLLSGSKTPISHRTVEIKTESECIEEALP
jgi:hypothetical protein